MKIILEELNSNNLETIKNKLVENIDTLYKNDEFGRI